MHKAIVVFEAALRSVGDAVPPLLTGAFAVGMNIGLNYVLIFGHLGFPALGVEGEAGIVNARLQVRWADDQHRIAAFELPTDGWTAIDLRTTIAVTPRVDLVVEGLNLTDSDIRYHASPLKDVAPMAGRGVRVALRAEF